MPIECRERMPREQILEMVRQVVLTELKECLAKVYLFGSWARAQERQSSDIDIAVEWTSEAQPARLVRLREVLEESTIPYRIDVVDLSEADAALVVNVRKEGVLWKG